MILEAEKPSGSQHISDLHLTFQVQLREEEGGGVHDLCVNGGAKPVTVENVREYVHRYAHLRMVTWCEPILKVRQHTFSVLTHMQILLCTYTYPPTHVRMYVLICKYI